MAACRRPCVRWCQDCRGGRGGLRGFDASVLGRGAGDAAEPPVGGGGGVWGRHDRVAAVLWSVSCSMGPLLGKGGDQRVVDVMPVGGCY